MKCTKCYSKNTTKKGFLGENQRYYCKECQFKFIQFKQKKIDFIKCLDEYIFNKQTLREIEERYGISKKVFRNFLRVFDLPSKAHRPRIINLIIDATYFGKRKDGTSWGVLLSRDPKMKEDSLWDFIEHETKESYQLQRQKLEQLGYKIISVTLDGFPGLFNVFKDIPFQICLFHVKKMIVRNTTTYPQTEAGKELYAMSKILHSINEKDFKNWLQNFLDTYGEFLNEKTTNVITGRSFYTHKKLRSVVNSLVNNISYLFTYQKYPELNIPSTSNSIESHFSHIKDILRIHRGLTRHLKEKILHMIFLNSSIVKQRK